MEDSLVFARGLRFEIEAAGLRVELTDTLAGAVELLNRRQFAAAVLDLTLPDARDVDIVKKVVEYGVPTIVFTGTFDLELRGRILDLPVFDYLLKDNADAMRNVVTNLLRLLRNQRTKILLVDDSATSRAYFRRELQRYRFELLESTSAQEAMLALRRNPDIQLMIIDYEMPGMNGCRLVSELRRKHPREELALIGVSTRSEALLSTEFLKRGANDYLHKAIPREEFYNRILLNLEILESFRKLREQAGALKKLNSEKDRFLGIAAHDLRNPLSSITGLTQLLDWEGSSENLTAEQREYIGTIQELSEQMNTLVTDLLDISAIESGKLELECRDASLVQLIQERLRIFRLPAQKKDIGWVLQFDEVPPVRLDRNRMGQVVDNLLSNAIKFSPPHSSITVSVSRSEAAERESPAISFAVRDQGPGLTEKDRERLFGVFQKLSARPTGDETSTGLGLSIVKKIVDAHGGTIEVESEPGEGACFRVLLPA